MSSLTINSNKFYLDAVEKTAKELNIKNIMAAPRIAKVSINIGMGKYDNKQKQEIIGYLEKLSGQKPKAIKSRVSVAGFKLRKNELVACQVTLRGKAAQDFLVNLVFLGLPRTRDFRGIKMTSFDKNNSTYSVGVENASIFPAVGFDIGYNFGMQVNVSFAATDENNVVLLKNLNFPFKK
ncbi:MAG: 50S ribosomal protein L5 [Patescibacteria group bacterium]